MDQFFDNLHAFDEKNAEHNGYKKTALVFSSSIFLMVNRQKANRKAANRGGILKIHITIPKSLKEMLLLD